MLDKKKVSIKTKDVQVTHLEEIKPSRGRPKSRIVENTPCVPKLPSSRVFSVGIETNKSSTLNRTNNIIRLKLKMSNITKLEKYIADNKSTSSFASWTGDGSEFEHFEHFDHFESEFDIPVKSHGLASFVKHTVVSELPRQPIEIKKEEPSHRELPVNRKDLIINSGIKRTSSEPLSVFSESWPLTSPYACWYCCHFFDTTPVGIPAILTNYTFRCYGNFCSYNCAKRYLCPLKDDDDDMACMQSSNDIYKGDDLGEKSQLLELLYHLETDSDMNEPIKPAPRRLILKMFGGNKTIEEFRHSFGTNTTYHTFKMPLASMAYHMEECTDVKADTKRKFKNMSLDVAKLEQDYQNLIRANAQIQKTFV